MGQFSTGPMNKAVPSFRNSSKGDGRHSGHLSLLKTCSHLWHLCCLK